MCLLFTQQQLPVRSTCWRISITVILHIVYYISASVHLSICGRVDGDQMDLVLNTM